MTARDKRRINDREAENRHENEVRCPCATQALGGCNAGGSSLCDVPGGGSENQAQTLAVKLNI